VASALLASGDVRRDGSDPRSHGPTKELLHLGRTIERFAEDHSRTVRIRGEEPRKLAEDGSEAILAGRRSEQEPRQSVLPVREDGAEHRFADVLFRWEVVEDGGLTDAHCV